MSYCVNCGVELASSESVCPLCKTPVINPNDTGAKRGDPSAPYPKRVENILHTVDRRYGALLTTIALAIPVICSGLIDILVTHRLSWSLYVTGAAICLFIWVLFPLLLRKRNVYLHVLYNSAALLAYLAAIFFNLELEHEYFALCCPLVMSFTALAYALIPILRSKRLKNKLYKPAIVLFIFAAFLVVLELIIDLNVDSVFSPTWSLIAAASLSVCGCILMLLESKHRLKDEILKRLFL